MRIKQAGGPSNVGFSFEDQKVWMESHAAMTKGLAYRIVSSGTAASDFGTYYLTTTVGASTELGSMHVIPQEDIAAAGTRFHGVVFGRAIGVSAAAFSDGAYLEIDSAGKFKTAATAKSRVVAIARAAASGADEEVEIDFCGIGSLGQDVGT